MSSHSDLIQWSTKHYSELHIDELYAILRLRSQVFIVEQGFRFLEMDNKDQLAYHILGWRGDGGNSELIATSRLFAKDLSYEGYQAIGRVACADSCRGQGVGKQLMTLSISECARLFGVKDDIKINAQYRLKGFYGSCGFRQISEIYKIDDVDHITMVASQIIDHNTSI